MNTPYFELLSSINKMIDSLESMLDDKTIMEQRSFYGLSFYLSALSLLGKKSRHEKFILKIIGGFNLDDSTFHWEFNKYAFLHLNEHLKKQKEIARITNCSRFNYSSATNWRLLNLSCKFDVKNSLKTKLWVKIRQDRDGFIWDARKVRSSQYHAFSSALLGEIASSQNKKWAEKSFIRSIDCTCKMILNDGEFNYLGRGQFQSFGYGPAIYSLIMAYLRTNDIKYFSKYKLLQKYLISRLVEDVAPLMINKEDIISGNFKSDSEDHIGWYPYNNFLDYTMFLLFYLVKTYCLMEKSELEQLDVDESTSINKNIGIRNFSGVYIYENENYSAIHSSVVGFNTNGIPNPFILSRGEMITPVFGGEQFQDSLYKDNMLGLPTRLDGKKEKFRTLYINENRQILFSKSGVLINEFTFGESDILVKNRIFSVKKFFMNFAAMVPLYLSDDGNDCYSNMFTTRGKLEKENGYSSSGIFSIYRPNVSKKIEVRININHENISSNSHI